MSAPNTIRTRPILDIPYFPPIYYRNNFAVADPNWTAEGNMTDSAISFAAPGYAAAIGLHSTGANDSDDSAWGGAVSTIIRPKDTYARLQLAARWHSGATPTMYCAVSGTQNGDNNAWNGLAFEVGDDLDLAVSQVGVLPNLIARGEFVFNILADDWFEISLLFRTADLLLVSARIANQDFGFMNLPAVHGGADNTSQLKVHIGHFTAANGVSDVAFSNLTLQGYE